MRTDLHKSFSVITDHVAELIAEDFLYGRGTFCAEARISGKATVKLTVTFD